VTRRGNTISFSKLTPQHVEPIYQCPAKATCFDTELIVMLCGLVVHHIWLHVTVSWGGLLDDTYKNNPRARTHAHTHSHTHLNRQARRTAFYERDLQKGFWRNFQSRNQLCLKVQGIYLLFLLQHAVLHYSQFILRFSRGSYFSVLQIRGVVTRINITQTLQWIGTSKSFEDSDRSSNHTACEAAPNTVIFFLAKKRKINTIKH